MKLLRTNFLCFIIFLGQCNLSVYSQSTKIKAESKFEAGLLQFNNSTYKYAKDNFISSREVLGGTNLSIQYYLVKTYYNLEDYKRCRSELELYFDLYEGRKEQVYFATDTLPKRHLSKRDEMIKLLDKVDEKIQQINKVKNYDIEMQESLNWIKSKIDDFGVHSNKYIYNSYDKINENSDISNGGLEDVVAHGKIIRGCLMTFDNNFNVTIKYEVKNRKLPIVYKFSAKDIRSAEMQLDTAEMEIAYLNSEGAIVEKSEADYYFLRVKGFSDQKNKFCLNWDIVYQGCRLQANFLDLMLTNDRELTQRLINAFNYIGKLNKQKRLRNKPSEKF